MDNFKKELKELLAKYPDIHGIEFFVKKSYDIEIKTETGKENMSYPLVNNQVFTPTYSNPASTSSSIPNYSPPIVSSDSSCVTSNPVDRQITPDFISKIMVAKNKLNEQIKNANM